MPYIEYLKYDGCNILDAKIFTPVSLPKSIAFCHITNEVTYRHAMGERREDIYHLIGGIIQLNNIAYIENKETVITIKLKEKVKTRHYYYWERSIEDAYFDEIKLYGEPNNSYIGKLSGASIYERGKLVYRYEAFDSLRESHNKVFEPTEIMDSVKNLKEYEETRGNIEVV